MTDEQIAFIEACSGIAPDEVTEIFLTKLDDHDAFFEQYQEYYSGLADAHQVWCQAKSYVISRVEQLGAEGYGTLAIAAMLRKGGEE